MRSDVVVVQSDLVDVRSDVVVLQSDFLILESDIKVAISDIGYLLSINNIQYNDFQFPNAGGIGASGELSQFEVT